MLNKQSIRSTAKIFMAGELASKDELISLSKEWNEVQERFFRKMLHQGGSFKIKGVQFFIAVQEQVVNSNGDKDPGAKKLPGDARF